MSIRKALFVSAGAAVATALSALPAQASIAYSYVAYENGSAVSNVDLSVGGPSQVVQIYLDESLTSGSPSLIAGDNGLDSAGFSIQTTSTVPSSPAQLSGIAGDTTNTFIGGSAAEGNSDTNLSRRIADSSSASDDTASYVGPVPNGQGLISLGFVTLAPGAAAGITTFKVWDYDRSATLGGQTLTVGNSYGNTSGLANNTTLGYFDLDKSVTAGGNNPYTYSGADANPTTFTVTTIGVPEPATLGIAIISVGALLTRRRSVIA